MGDHFILKCRLCGEVISQDQCSSKDKKVRLTICAKCKLSLEPGE